MPAGAENFIQKIELLRKENVAFVVADTAGKFPYAEDLTAEFVYIRLHGAEKLYVSGYDDRALKSWGGPDCALAKRRTAA